MNIFFKYHGCSDKGHYFTLVIDVEPEAKEKLQGITILFKHFHTMGDKLDVFKRISYLDIPTFTEEPSPQILDIVKDRVERYFSPFVPYNMPLYEKGCL